MRLLTLSKLFCLVDASSILGKRSLQETENHSNGPFSLRIAVAEALIGDPSVSEETISSDLSSRLGIPVPVHALSDLVNEYRPYLVIPAWFYRAIACYSESSPEFNRALDIFRSSSSQPTALVAASWLTRQIEPLVEQGLEPCTKIEGETVVLNKAARDRFVVTVMSNERTQQGHSIRIPSKKCISAQRRLLVADIEMSGDELAVRAQLEDPDCYMQEGQRELLRQNMRMFFERPLWFHEKLATLLKDRVGALNALHEEYIEKEKLRYVVVRSVLEKATKFWVLFCIPTGSPCTLDPTGSKVVAPREIRDNLLPYL
jgi:hypothetical protein